MSSATIVNDCENGDCVQQPSSSTFGVPSNTTTTQVIVAPSNATTKEASRRHQGNRKRSRGITGLDRADGQPSSSKANANPTRSRGTGLRRFIEDDMTPADRAMTSGTSDVPTPSRGIRKGSRSRSCRNTTEGPGLSSARADREPGISSETADREPGSSDASFTEDDLTPAERAIVNDCENGDCVQQPSSSTSGLPSNTTTTQVNVAPSNATATQASRRHHGNPKRSRGRTGLARADGQPSSSEANANPTRSRRTTPREFTEDDMIRFIEDDMTPADRSISDSPLVHGTSDVPTPSTRRRQGSRSRSRRNTPEGPGSSSARADGEPGISSETADREPGSSDATFTEDDLTHAERAVSGKPLLRNSGKHPSVYARAGQNPLTRGLSFRGAWKKAVALYRVSNNQYKELFVAAGFGDFLKIEPVELPQGYLIALTERWFAETNTLHLPCCEIGPTPVDWTMITGLHFEGRPIKLSSEYKKDRALELLGVEAIKGNKIPMRDIKPKMEEVMDDPPNNEAKERIFRRLFLYIVGSCFFGNNHSVIHYELVQFLENVDDVGDYNWGAITYAAFLTGMRRKVTGEIGSFTAFWQFLLFWAFEYLNISRPEDAENDLFPWATRWKFPKKRGTLDNSELTACRCQLDYVDDASQVTWQPYLASEKYSSDAINSSIALAKSRVPFLSLDTWEYYLGERCQRQLGLPCLVPSDPPEEMYGERDEAEDHIDHINVGISVETLVRDEEEEYPSWFADKSIGKIVDVTRLIGGPDIGGKVIGHWMAKHRPGMILVPESEVKEITEALGTADAERKKLREELSRVRRASDF